LFGNYASLREMNVPMITALYIFVIFLLVIANGFFVASEFALVGVRRTRIAMLAEAGNQRAKLLLELVDNLNAYISATQLGITMASLALGWIGEPVFAHLLEAPLEGRVSDAVRHTVAFAIAFSVITFLHIVLGELAPKTLALERAEKVALAIAWPMRIFYQLFRWPIRMLDWAGTRTIRLFGLLYRGRTTPLDRHLSPKRPSQRGRTAIDSPDLRILRCRGPRSDDTAHFRSCAAA
jgi:magnesium and cobalt exporter, CNNM family